MTSDNIEINSTNFNVDENGNMTCSSANVTGGEISLSGSTADTVKIKVERENGTTSTNMTPGGFVLKDSSEIRFWANPTLTTIASSDGTKTLIAGGAIYQQNSSDEQTIISNASTGNITCVSLTQTSREENKKNFEKLESALKILKATDIYKYNLKNQKDTDKKHIGFVIGENYKYAHELTAEDEEGKEIGVDNYSMTSVLWKAVQEQQEVIENLQEEINKLKGEK